MSPNPGTQPTRVVADGDTLRIDLPGAAELVAELRATADAVAADRRALEPLLTDGRRLIGDVGDDTDGHLRRLRAGLDGLADDLDRRIVLLGGVAGGLTIVDDLSARIAAWHGHPLDPGLAALRDRRRVRLLALVGGDVGLAARVARELDGGRSPADALRAVADADAAERLRAQRIATVGRDLGLGPEAAGAMVDRVDRALAELATDGVPDAQAITAVALAEEFGLDLALARREAAASGGDIVGRLGRMLVARGIGVSVAELEVLGALGDNFAAYDGLTRLRWGPPDGLVGLGDLRHVVDHPDRFTPAQVEGARIILDHPELWHRLDTAFENHDVIGGDGFGRRTPGDGLVSVADLRAFMEKAQVHHLLAGHAAAIDVAADPGGDVDGVVAAADLERYLADHPDLPDDVVAGITTMLDRGWFHEDWWEAHRDELAAGAAVLAGGVVVVASGGTATVAAMVLVGAAAAAGTTLAVNVATGEPAFEDLARNAVIGSVIGLSIHGIATGSAAVATAETAIGRSAAMAAVVGDGATVVEWGGTDLLLPERWEDDVHTAASDVGMLASGFAGSVGPHLDPDAPVIVRGGE